MPTQILQRPDYFGDAITHWFEREIQKQQQEHDEDIARRHRQQGRIAMGVGALGGLGFGLLAAPALGLAGTAAGIETGTAGAAAAGGSLAIPATAGIFGAGGAATFGGTLAATSLGATLGNSLVSGDYGPALAAAGNLADKSDNLRTFGYNATPQERAAYAHAAITSGADFGAMVNAAKMGGPPVSQQLAGFVNQKTGVVEYNQLARDENLPYTGEQLYEAAKNNPTAVTDMVQASRKARQQQHVQQKYQDRLLQNYADVDSKLQSLGDRYGWEPVPDQKGIAGVQQDLGPVQADLQEYQRSNGQSGASLEELQGSITGLNSRLNTAIAPSGIRMRPKLPTAQEEFEQGRVVDANGQPTNTSLIRGADGNMKAVHAKTIEGTTKLPWENVPPGVDPAVVQKNWITQHTMPDGSLIVPEGFKLEKQQKSATDELLNKVVAEGFKPDSTGEIPFNDPATYLRTVRAVKSLGRITKIDEEAQGMLEKIGTGTLTLPEVESLAAKLNAIPGAVDADVKAMMEGAAKDAIRNMPPPPPMMGPPAPPPPPPPGSAAAADITPDRLRALQERASPAGQQRLQAAKESSAKALAALESKNKTQSLVAGLESKETLNPLEKLTIDNLAAGIDEEVTVIQYTESGPHMSKIVKGKLTPELLKELHDGGISIPGLDGD